MANNEANFFKMIELISANDNARAEAIAKLGACGYLQSAVYEYNAKKIAIDAEFDAKEKAIEATFN